MKKPNFDLGKLDRLHPQTKSVYRQKPWARPLVEKVVNAGGEIFKFEGIKGRSEHYEIGYRPVGTKQFLRLEVYKSHAGQAAGQMAVNILRMLRSEAIPQRPSAQEKKIKATNSMQPMQS